MGVTFTQTLVNPYTNPFTTILENRDREASNENEKKHVDKNSAVPGSSNASKRLVHLSSLPITALAPVIDTLFGIVAMLGILLSGGTEKWAIQKEAKKYAAEHLAASKYLLILPYLSLLKALNPAAKGEEIKKDSWLTKKANPLFSTVLAKAETWSHSSKIVDRHVLARVGYLAATLLELVIKIVDLVIGAFLAVASLFAGGRNDWLNKNTQQQLQATDGIGAALQLLMSAINPQAKPLPQISN